MTLKNPAEAQFWYACLNNKIIDAVKSYRVWKDKGIKEAYMYIHPNWNKLRNEAFKDKPSLDKIEA